MAETTAVLPDYAGACLTNVVPALLRPPRRRARLVPSVALRRADRCVLLVLDGLGWEQLQSPPRLMPRVGAMAGGADHDGGALDDGDRADVDHDRPARRASTASSATASTSTATC